ncbi:PTPRK [Mytilus coruscus]|uniref:protein-tyrosine-phosphatase n=1 Tax=Mytilus coruscus TaxID=42192 RepID=A0A6J8BIP2_MYTCO|nr:PTPRK [Mytilus coruscus]
MLNSHLISGTCKQTKILINIVGVLCPFPNVTDNLVLLSNKTEYRFGDHTTFDCVGDFELPNLSDATRECIVDEHSKENGTWTGEIPICQAKPAAKHSGAMGPAIGGGIGSAVTVIVVVVLIVFIIRRRTVPQKNKDEMRCKESTLELNNSNIYSQVEERETKSYIEKPVLESQTKNVYYNEVKEDNDSGGYYAFSVGSQLPKDAIEVKNFHGYVEKRRGKEGDILKEFLKLKSGLQKPTDAALKPGNRLKNKYKDMYAYDETRVILDNSSYINASFIQGYGQVRKYIAAQGPLDKTVDDFWRMVWEYDCGKETKIVLQFHFTAWPDKDVPKYASSLVHFRHKVNTTSTVAKGPMVVHCSAGVGRTGTYIALDYIVNEAKQRDYVEVFRSVEILRNQRVNMVQTAHQYLFLHEAVLEALMCPNTGIPCRDFPDNYKDLMRFDNNKKKHKLQIEYELMNSISSRHDEEAFSKGKSEENRGKNRYSNIIPVGSEMPLLSTAVDGRNEYINAVFLPVSISL